VLFRSRLHLRLRARRVWVCRRAWTRSAGVRGAGGRGGVPVWRARSRGRPRRPRRGRRRARASEVLGMGVVGRLISWLGPVSRPDGWPPWELSARPRAGFLGACLVQETSEVGGSGGHAVGPPEAAGVQGDAGGEAEEAGEAAQEEGQGAHAQGGGHQE